MKQFLFVMLFATVLVGCGKKEEAPPNVEVGENQTTIEVGTDLLGASISGNLNAVKRQIAFGADLDQRTTDGQNNTPLILAATFGNEKVANALMDAGADVNLKKIDGSTALHAAAFMGHSGIVRALLENGAEPNIRNLSGSTALDGVSMTWDDAKDIYKLIGALLAPYGLKMDYERIRLARSDCAQILESRGGQNAPKEAAKHPPITDIFGAVFYEDLAAAKKFIADGVDLNAPEPKDGNTPLHLATLVCNIEITKALIAAGANVNAKNKKGETPLVAVALKWGTMSFVYGLLEGAAQKKFDLNRIKRDREKVAQILRAAGAN
jgi:ankyrin repeat protein